MFRIDHPTAAVVIPTPAAPGAAGFFTKGDPLLAVPATRVTADWLNAVQEELSNAVEAQGIALDKGNRRQLAQALANAVAAGANGSLLINANFRFWQRHGPSSGNNPTNDVRGFHGPDHWLFDAGQAGESGALSRIRQTTPYVGSFSGEEWVLRWNKTTASGPGAETSIAQRVEHVGSLEGEAAVFAFDGFKSAGSNLTILGVDLVQNFGTGGSPSSDVTTPMSAQAGLTIDGTPRRFVFSATVPSISGKTLGTNTPGYLEVKVRVALAVTFDVYLTACVLARSTVDPGWFPRPEGQDLRLCRRYYQKSTILDALPTVSFNEDQALWDFNWSNGGPILHTGRFRLPVSLYRFATVTVTSYYANGTAGQIEEHTTGVSPVYHAVTMSGTFGTLEDKLGAPQLTSPPAGGTLRFFRFGWSAEAEI